MEYDIEIISEKEIERILDNSPNSVDQIFTKEEELFIRRKPISQLQTWLPDVTENLQFEWKDRELAEKFKQLGKYEKRK